MAPFRPSFNKICDSICGIQLQKAISTCHATRREFGNSSSSDRQSHRKRPWFIEIFRPRAAVGEARPPIEQCRKQRLLALEQCRREAGCESCADFWCDLAVVSTPPRTEPLVYHRSEAPPVPGPRPPPPQVLRCNHTIRCPDSWSPNLANVQALSKDKDKWTTQHKPYEGFTYCGVNLPAINF